MKRKRTDTGEEKYYFSHYDLQGSVTNMVSANVSGVYLAEGNDYDPFGKEESLISKTTGEAISNEMKYTGAVEDRPVLTGDGSSGGLYYLSARHYDPNTGRFLQQDTYKGDAHTPWTQNLYAYTGNNPVNYVDPTGHAPHTYMSDGGTNKPYTTVKPTEGEDDEGDVPEAPPEIKDKARKKKLEIVGNTANAFPELTLTIPEPEVERLLINYYLAEQKVMGGGYTEGAAMEEMRSVTMALTNALGIEFGALVGVGKDNRIYIGSLGFSTETSGAMNFGDLGVADDKLRHISSFHSHPAGYDDVDATTGTYLSVTDVRGISRASQLQVSGEARTVIFRNNGMAVYSNKEIFEHYNLIPNPDFYNGVGKEGYVQPRTGIIRPAPYGN